MLDHPSQVSHYKESLLRVQRSKPILVPNRDNWPDILQCISFAATVMNSLQKIWFNRCKSTLTKMCLNQSLVLSVLLYASETQTLITADLKILGAFHLRFQQQCLGIRWFDKIPTSSSCSPLVYHQPGSRFPSTVECRYSVTSHDCHMRYLKTRF